jgi:glucokinase
MTDMLERDCWVGFDLGGTKMLAQVFDDEFETLGRDRKKTKATSDTENGLERIVETIDAALANANVDRSRLAGLGIGCPGPVDMDRGMLLEPPNLAWSQVPFQMFLEEEFGCPVAVLNDVDAGVYAEYCYGAGQGARCVVGVFPGTGIGGGCVYNGEILRGKHSTCMEIGHIHVMPNGPLCGCGQRGCLESVASRLAIAAQVAKAAHRGEAPHILETAGTDLSDIRSGVLADAITAGDEVVKQIVREAARQIGIALAGVIHVLGPEVVVLGGGLVEAMPELFVEQVSKSARKRVMSAFREAFTVVPSTLKDDAVALGAAAWARHVIQGAPAAKGVAVGA